MDRASLLEFVCYIGAGLALVAYVLSFVRGRRFARPFNSVGLVLTAGALIVLPTALQIGQADARVNEGWLTAVLLLLALWSQGWAALKRRKPRDGAQDRAADRAPDAAP